MGLATEKMARAILAEIEETGAIFDASEPEHGRRFLNLDRASGEFLLFIVRAARRRHIVEIGTSSGCGTIWLALALRKLAAGGRLITIERSQEKQREAIENVTRAGLQPHVEFLLGDATDIVRTLDDPIDCVFFDADRASAHLQFEALLPRLTPDCLLVSDNAISHATELQAYFTLLATRPEFQTLTLPVGKGLHLAFRNIKGDTANLHRNSGRRHLTLPFLKQQQEL